MKVSELMKADVQTCQSNTNLETVAMQMWNYDCGAIPVVDDAGIPTGIVTDRDIAMGSAFQHKPLQEITTQQVINHRELLSCKPDDDVDTALTIMMDGQIHRLPVVDNEGLLKGIISMDDMILVADAKKTKTTPVSTAQVITALKQICAPVKQSQQMVG
ncbi:MAG: CBS domain-containing protein [Oceanicoccus sp.]|uniref:CBS domain-containing protein n=1 Tax=Oceanicoccus sp. TaxID=2691044 RepID=UPI002607CC4C|nr:CBS domain-containing protein [Oceanicoccus sp.]MCP3906748.1 CBS domain-containing protein [Oceanicoccus sp.]MDG1772467.1 CBS domain-containing protein [Oceanicoccus sp.]